MAMSNNTGINGPNWIAPNTTYISKNTIPWHNTSPTPIDVNNITAYPVEIIQGEMFSVSHSMTDVVYTNHIHGPDEIKKMLITQLIEKMCNSDNKYVEFTKVLDPTTLDHTFRARIFVVPDTQVRLLRLNGFDK